MKSLEEIKMSEPVLIAVIAAGATIIAALIGIFAAKAKSGNKTIVKQKNKGKEKAIQIGVINVNTEDKKDERKPRN